MVTEPIARRDDPLTSYLAGDRPAQRVAARDWVVRILGQLPGGTDDSRLCLLYDLAVEDAERAGRPVKRVAHQRLRSARASLTREGKVTHAGDGTSLLGNRAQKWRLSDSKHTPTDRVGGPAPGAF